MNEIAAIRNGNNTNTAGWYKKNSQLISNEPLVSRNSGKQYMCDAQNCQNVLLNETLKQIIHTSSMRN